jgi:predicted nucleotidyltransferase
MTESALEQKRLAYGQALRAALERVLDQLTRMPQVYRVMLFGSYAAGRRDLFTDLDLLVVMDSDQDFVQRTAELYGQLQAGVDMDLLVYTPEEFERMRHSGFVRHAVKTGQVLYEKRRS